MSNVMARADVPEGAVAILLVVLLALAAAAVGVMHLLGVFRAKSVEGASRLGREESAWLLLGIFGAGLVLSVIVARVLMNVVQPPAGLRDVVVTAMLLAAAFVFMLLGNAMLRNRGTERLGIDLRRMPRGVLIGVGSILLMLPLVYLAGLVVTLVIRQMGLEDPAPHPVLQQLGERPDPRIIALLVVSAVVLAPLGEELVFRGLLQTMLVRLFSYFRGAGDEDRAGYDGREDAGRKDRSWTGTRQPGIQLDPDTPSTVSVSTSVPVDEHAMANRPPVTPPPLPEHVTGEAPQPVVPLGYAPPPAPPRATAGVRWAAIVVTSVLFALVHGEPAFVPPLMILSMALGYTYERTGNLWVPIVMHAGFNGFQMVAFLQVMQPG